MKTKIKLLTLILALPFSIFSQALESVTTYFDPYTQSRINEKYTVKKGTPSKQGLYKKYDKYGTLIYEAYYKNNKKNGTAKSYYSRREVNTFSYYSNAIGKLSGEYNFIDDVSSGESKQYAYTKDGKRVNKSYKLYDEGEIVKYIEYFPNGDIKKLRDKNGRGFEMYNEETMKEEFTMVDGLTHGIHKSYFKNGNLEMEGNFYMGKKTGVWKEYYQSGGLMKEWENFENGKLKFENTFHKNGNPEVKLTHLRNDNYLGKVFDEQGVLREEREYVLSKNENFLIDGLLKGFSADGKLEYEIDYTEGKQDGKYKEYYKSDKIKVIQNVVKGNLEGETISYFENGKIDSLVTYEVISRYGTDKSYLADTAFYYYESGQMKAKMYFKNYGKPLGPNFYFNEDGDISQVSLYKKKSYGGYENNLTTLSFDEYQNMRAIEALDTLQYDLTESNGLVKKEYEVNYYSQSAKNKKHLYKAYEIVLNDLTSHMSSSATKVEELKLLRTILELDKRMLELVKIPDTKDLEKEVKRTKEPELILKALGINK